MQTKCPKCSTLLVVTDELMSIANGNVRCGDCKQIFNAKDNLLEQEDYEIPSIDVVPSIRNATSRSPVTDEAVKDLPAIKEFPKKNNAENNALSSEQTGAPSTTDASPEKSNQAKPTSEAKSMFSERLKTNQHQESAPHQSTNGEVTGKKTASTMFGNPNLVADTGEDEDFLPLFEAPDISDNNLFEEDNTELDTSNLKATIIPTGSKTKITSDGKPKPANSVTTTLETQDNTLALDDSDLFASPSSNVSSDNSTSATQELDELFKKTDPNYNNKGSASQTQSNIAHSNNHTKESSKKSKSIFVIGAVLCVLLIVAVCAQALYGARYVLVKNPQFTSMVVGACKLIPLCDLRDPKAFEVVKKEMTAHPVYDNVLVLKIQIINNAEFDQNLPDVFVVLSDKMGKAVAKNTFTSDQYEKKNQWIQAKQNRTLELLFNDPDPKAAGFDVDFH